MEDIKSIDEITEQILTDEEKRRVKELKEFRGCPLFDKNKINKNNTGEIEMEENKMKIENENGIEKKEEITEKEQMLKIEESHQQEIKEEQQEGVQKDIEHENNFSQNLEQTNHATTVIEEINDMLKPYGYEIFDKFLRKINKKSTTLISNFISFAKERITIDNGIDEDTKYKVEGLQTNTLERLPTLTIDKKAYETQRYILGSKWEGKAFIFNNKGNELSTLSQILSQKTMKKKTIYTHTGFRKINEHSYYLFQKGAIGEAGIEKGIETNIKAESDGLERYCFTQKECDEKQALKIGLDFLDIAPKEITIPIIATTYLSVLVSLFAENGIKADYVLYLVGKSGSKKSTLAALALNHFGDSFDRNNFTSSFRDSLNVLEKKAFILKDTLNIIDDLNPETYGKDKQELFEKIVAMYGDRVGRGRMASDGKTARNPYSARGLCIATGELIPNIALSRLARTIIINIKPDSVNTNKLTILQNNKEKLAFSMMKFIQYTIVNEELIITNARNRMLELQANPNNNIHGRTQEAINVMIIAYEMFVDFMKKHLIINEKESETMKLEANNVLLEIANLQQEEIKQSDPINMFYAGIKSLLNINKIWFKDYKTGEVIGNPNATFVGYIDKDKGFYYLLKNVIYREVSNLYASNNEKFPVSLLTLLRAMRDAELIYMQKKDRFEVERTEPSLGTKKMVIAIKIRDELEDKETKQE